METDLFPSKLYNAISIVTPSPDGTMNIVIDELDDKEHTPVAIHIYIGKAGTSIRAWAAAMENIMTFLLVNGHDIGQIIILLSNLTSDKWITLSNNVQMKSSPQAIGYALQRYNQYRQEHYNNDVGHGGFGQGEF